MAAPHEWNAIFLQLLRSLNVPILPFSTTWKTLTQHLSLSSLGKRNQNYFVFVVPLDRVPLVVIKVAQLHKSKSWSTTGNSRRQVCFTPTPVYRPVKWLSSHVRTASAGVVVVYILWSAVLRYGHGENQWANTKYSSVLFKKYSCYALCSYRTFILCKTEIWCLYYGPFPLSDRRSVLHHSPADTDIHATQKHRRFC